MATRVYVLNETCENYGDNADICLQWCRYMYDNGSYEMGYRFMWRIDGGLRAHRGQARIPSREVANRLFAKADEEGWGNNGE